ncbi:restriction endonuclease subunit S, partial [Ligilactobacillus salivarius]|uniref:restriction endonuclease subunit S n=1 Tax=Ligilactobacillus salivarius TaxID=1624 RepID=UPI001EDD699D
KLGEIGSVSMNKRIFKDETSTIGEIPFYKIGTFGGKADAFITRKKYEEYKKKYPYPQKGNLLISASGSIGRIIEYNGEEAYYQDSNIVWLDHDNTILDVFLKPTYEIIKWDGIEGTTIKRLYNKNILNTVIYKPTIDEQRKIGKLFIILNNTIQLHERKYEELTLIKKALLQKLFPKKDGFKPEVRYKNFNDAWEQRKLGEVVERFDNLRIPVTSSKREKGITPYYGANGIQDYVQGYTHDGEFVLVAEDGANDLQNYPVHYVNGKVWVNNHAHVLQGKNKMVDNLFLVNAIKQIKIETYLVGGSRAKLNADVMMKLPIKVPTFNEQQRLGKYFARLDSLITLHQCKLEKLKQLKKFLLQNMFI